MRHTAKVKELVNRMMRQGALWQDCSDGWQALETTIRLTGWGGYTSRKLAPSQLMANFIALFYNWWNLYPTYQMRPNYS